MCHDASGTRIDGTNTAGHSHNETHWTAQSAHNWLKMSRVGELMFGDAGRPVSVHEA